MGGCRLKIACDDLSICFNTYRDWLRDVKDKRCGPIGGPKNKLNNETREKIIKTATSKKYVDDSPAIIVNKLADDGIYIASETSFYKVLKDEKMLAHRGKARPRVINRPEALMAIGPNEIWSWDITYLPSSIRGIFFYLYLFLDIFSRKIVGFDIFECEAMENSAKLLDKICLDEKINKGQLHIHADNGGPMKGATMLATMQKLGVKPSFSRPSVSNDNPYSEAMFRTLKYYHKYPGQFETIEDAKKWVVDFVCWYNTAHLHSGIKFVTPAQRHKGKDKEILEKRKQVYQSAKDKYPERWNGRDIKNFEREEKVFLNHLQKEKYSAIQKSAT